ncbi:MAG TPA: ABC transporter permease [Candidatus Ventrousia excrementavium]|uniref:ABC transporter permease n=1 Tax=Candidatus Ventrousia excrementavium TaxID=2840961 RepID=A0A9D1IT32_9CLOT|nr:ABC transporter permease [Candidatus Ventrousia excrementavium]
MVTYIIKRVLYMAMVLFIVVSITFFMIHSVPGDPLTSSVMNLPDEVRDNYYARYGLDKPLFEQYLRFWKLLFTEGSLGESIKYPGRMVEEFILKYAGISAKLGIISVVLGFSVGTIFGILAAVFKNKWPDYAVMLTAIAGVTIPVFVLAAVFQYFFTVKLTWFPTTGWGTVRHMILPIACMCLGPIATYARYMRSSALDVLGQDYILTAESKGVSSLNVVRRHVLRNSMLPSITLLGPSVASVFTGSFVIESMFAIPGLGTYFIRAINERDFTMVLGMNLFYCLLYIASLLLVDILYVFIDPRIRLAAGKERRKKAHAE